MKEEFRDIKDFEGLYQISNLGRVKSIRFRKEKILKPFPTVSGYLMVDLRKNKKSKYISIHRLVAIAFILNEKNKPEVNHINGIKADNRVENIEWSTRSENVKHAYKMGLMCKKGMNHSRLKLNEMQVRVIRRILELGKLKQRRIGEIFKITPEHVSLIKNRKVWSHIDE